MLREDCSSGGLQASVVTQMDKYIALTSVIDRASIKLPEELESSVDDLGKELSAISNPVSPAPVFAKRGQLTSRQHQNFGLDKRILPTFRGGDLMAYQVFKE